MKGWPVTLRRGAGPDFLSLPCPQRTWKENRLQGRVLGDAAQGETIPGEGQLWRAEPQSSAPGESIWALLRNLLFPEAGPSSLVSVTSAPLS